MNKGKPNPGPASGVRFKKMNRVCKKCGEEKPLTGEQNPNGREIR